MPKSSEISLRRAAVGLLSAAKKRSRCVSCSGVTRDLLRFSRGSPVFDFEVADRGSAVASILSSSFVGESGWGSVRAERGTSPGVVGDIEALGEDAVSSVTRVISSAMLYLDDESRLRWGSLERLRSPGGLSMENSESLAVEGKCIIKLNTEMQQNTKTDTYPPYPGGPKKSN